MSKKRETTQASSLLKNLLGRKKISTKQLLQVIEHRRDILVMNMKKFSQKTLGQLACLDSGDGFYHELHKDNPQVISLDSKFSLDTRGLYADNLFSREKSGQRLAFGIDEESWLLVEISYSKRERERTWPHENERATSVEVVRVDLQTILQEMEIDGMLVWNYFKIVTDEWVSNRKTLYDQACRVAEGMEEESTILSIIT